MENNMTYTIEGRVAIVTGAASGIGDATVSRLVEEGVNVLAVDLPGQGLPDKRSGSNGVICLEQDIAADDAPAKIVKTALDNWDRIDIVVNNAGVGGNSLAENMTDENWDRTMNVNVRAQFRLAREAIPHLKESPGGRIINTASVMADGTDYGLAAYCASKAGVAGLTRTLALELGKFGVTCNYVLPGAIQTGMTAASFANEDIAGVWAKKSVLRRLGQPIDLARGIVFLASDEAAFITGHGLNVDGGIMLRV
jgi:NAD(P)-dependent dehydrogenase (short-subunit alcohol dehydrogenase family)